MNNQTDSPMQDATNSVSNSGQTTGSNPIDKSIQLLSERFDRYTIELNEAIMNRKPAECISELIKLSTQAENDLNCLKILKNNQFARDTNNANPVYHDSNKRVGLAVTRRDLPKFQLSSDIPRPYPKEEVFENVEHFLSTFEKILISGQLDVEENWKTLLPLCLHNNYDAWWTDEVLTQAQCWDDVVKMMKKQFGNRSHFGKNIEKLWTIKMNTEESISQYTNRFLKAAHDTKLFNPKSHYLAAYFVVSCVEPVRKCFNMSWYSNHTESDPYTIQVAANLVSNILGGDYKMIESNDISFLPRHQKHILHRKERGVSSDSSKIQKRFNCKRHGLNNSHNTNQCFSSVLNSPSSSTIPLKNKFYDRKNVPRRASGDRQCKFNCGTLWSPGHRCDNYFQSEAFKDKRAKEDCVVLAISKNIQETDTDNDVDMEKDDQSASWKRIHDDTSFDFTYSNDISFNHTFEILEFNDNMPFDVLLGTDILSKMNIGLTGVAVKWNKDKEFEEDAQFKNLNMDECEYEPNNSPYGNEKERARFMSEIKQVVQKNQEIPLTSFCSVPESVIRLPTKDGATAYHRQYHVAHSLKPILDKQIDDWLKAGTIKKCPVNTSFNSPLLLVPKKNALGQTIYHRVCMDVRGLNKLLPDINFPVPLVREIFKELGGKKVFTTLDLKSAYNRFLVHPDDQHKLTFTHNNQQYCFQGTCFGLKHVTSVFCKVMAIIFQNMKCVQTYVDDLLIVSDSFEKHIEDVKKVIERLTSVNLILNPDKCHWAQHSVNMLGFVISEKGITVDPRKLTTVEKWPKPENNKDIQKFMGLINYFREYIPMISRVAAPIDRLRNESNVKQCWKEPQEESFRALKEILQSRTILHFPDPNKKFYVATDASLYGIAGVLFQKDDIGRRKHISFISSSSSPSQRNWGTTKRELYALVFSLHKFRRFLWGRKFEVHTDHKALVYIHTQKIANAMMIGWYETFMDFNFDVIHIKGILNTLPDALSRLYPPSDIKLEEDGTNNDKLTKNKVKDVAWRKKIRNKKNRKSVHAARLSHITSDSLDYMTPPEEERDKILKEAHEFGHFGSESIVKEVHSNGLHWNSIYREAIDIVKSCPECQKHNISKKGFHPLRSISAFLPFDHIGFDLAGPLQVTNEKQNVYLLVIVHICTKYVILGALPNKQSDTVAKALVQVFGDYEFPRIIQSDNEAEFKNSLMNEISTTLGIDRRYSCPYHSQGNGASESEVKTALNTLRKTVKADMHDWDHYLPMVQLAMNYKIRSRTNSSPFALMFARKVNVIRYQRIPNTDCENTHLPSLTLQELEERIQKMTNIIFPAIQERTRKVLELQNKKYNNSKMMVDIEEGTPVMVKLPNRPHKLAPIYEGPFVVVRKTQGGTYVLKDETNELLHREYTPSELKIVSIDETPIEDDLYEFEEIRDHRGDIGEREYLVKWKGYGERANTWESYDSFTDTRGIDAYWQKKKKLGQLEAQKKANKEKQVKRKINNQENIKRKRSRRK
ncbi:hypothetical protein G6F56_004110 [Rhizopus delemar]|nr:hypothetical protein G6F56_004110 [Rhizopus delemar]